MMNKLLERQMTRKEFILFFGVLALSITGFTGLFKKIEDGSFFENYPKQEKGYGSKPYGF